MDLSQIKKEKAEAERLIAIAVRNALTLFNSRTGLSFEDVRVNMQEVTSIGDANKQYMVGSVTCEVNYD